MLNAFVPGLAPLIPLIDDTMPGYNRYISNVYSMYTPGNTRTIGISYGSPGWFESDPSLPDFPLLPGMIATNNGLLTPGNRVGVRQAANRVMDSGTITIGQNTLNSAGAVGYYYYLPIQVTMYAEPAIPPAPVLPTGSITFDPPQCAWTNRPLSVQVTVEGDITSSVSGSAPRSYCYRELDCQDPLHILSSDHTSSCYDSETDQTDVGYTQTFDAAPVTVAGNSIPASPARTAIRSGTVELSKDGVGTLSAALSDWTAQTGVWAAGDPPDGSWRTGDPPALTAPAEDYRSASGIYRIDVTEPLIHAAGGGSAIYEPGNAIHVQLSDNLSGISEVRMLWSQSASQPDPNQMQVLPASTPEFTGTDSTTLTGAATGTPIPAGTGITSCDISVHEGVKRYGSWTLHLYARDRAGNVARMSTRVDIQVQLRQFRITDVTDPAWETLFWDPDAATGVRRQVWYLPEQMPILRNPLTKMPARIGSAFHFEMESLGMNEAADEIRILPRYFYLSSLKETDIRNAYEVDLYYNMGSEYMIPYGDPVRDKWSFQVGMKNQLPVRLGTAGSTACSIGTHAELVMDETVRNPQNATTAQWFGKYGLMSDTVALRKGTPVILGNRMHTAAMLDKGYILVNLTIDGYKDGLKLFSYMPDAWNAEGGPSDPSLWYAGDIMIFDLGSSMTDLVVPGGDR